MKKLKLKNRTKAKLGLKGIIIIILIIVAAGVSASIVTWYIIRKAPNRGIKIVRNSDFNLKYNFPGSGTKEDPYRIEDRTISVQTRFGIDITNTSEHFIIQNCNIQAESHCIFLSDVGNGTAIVRNNILSQFSAVYSPPVLIVKAPYCIFTNNTFAGTFREGFGLSYSSYSIVANNTFQNMIYFAISVFNAQNVTIEFNEVINTELVKVNHSSAIGIASADYCKILNNTVTGLFDYGIKIKQSSYVDVFYNHVKDGGYSGSFVLESDLCTIRHNVFEKYDSFGIALNTTNNMTIHSNVFSLNGNYAILQNSSAYNLLYHNSFFDNNLAQIHGISQSYDDGTENNWSNILILAGNHWSDLEWNGTAVYLIDGGSNVDNYPLENPLVSLLLF
ncbi:MAG: hypothetical protein FK733_17770 [Asgard group archaeon]|nr:hypothetical protein [Asgard group archaeon]